MPTTDPKETRKKRLSNMSVVLMYAAGVSGLFSFGAGLYSFISPTRTDVMPLFLGLFFALFLLSFLFAYLAHCVVTDKERQEKEALLKKEGEEKKEEEEKLARMDKYFRAFENGISSDYPKINSGPCPFSLNPDEVRYAFTSHAIFDRGTSHQIEISRELNVGIEKIIKLGQSRGVRDSYSTIQYEEHPGWLEVTNQRIVFISVPAVLLDFALYQVLSVGYRGQYVMLRTKTGSDENTNVLAFRIEGKEFPSWVFAAAAFRAIKDSAPPLPT